MSITTESPPGMVVCPDCRLDWGHSYCGTCKGIGHIPDPLLTEWFDPDTTPARMVEMLREAGQYDEAKILVYAHECDALLKSLVEGYRPWDDEHSVQFWTSRAPWTPGCTVSPQQASSFLRCLFAPPALPREMVECPEVRWVKREYHPVNCSCNGSGKVPAPLIDPRWKSATVLDLAKRVRGYNAREAGEYACDVCGNMPNDEGWLEHGRGCYTQSEDGGGGEFVEEAVTQPPQPIHGILADALQDAGCDKKWIIEHLMQPGHVAGKCWAIEELLKE